MRKKKRRLQKPPLTTAQILRWADEFYEIRGRWPDLHDGSIDANQTWRAVNRALVEGYRGLPGGTTLAKLLLKFRNRRHFQLPPPLTIPQILEWADAHFQKTGEWPKGHDATQIPKAPAGTTWLAVQNALNRGGRGLPSGMSLAQLLEEYRGARNRKALPELAAKQILAWADAHFAHTGRWPTHDSGPIQDTGETWLAVESALSSGIRGLPGGDSLAKFLARHRGVRNRMALPPLTEEQIIAWAKAHRKRTGMWPKVKEGPVHEAPEETWSGINAALGNGSRGLPGGSSLSLLLYGRQRGRE